MYEKDGYKKGLTVAEWEALHDLPPYSCYPEAEAAVQPRDKGHYMYRNASAEERLFILKCR